MSEKKKKQERIINKGYNNNHELMLRNLFNINSYIEVLLVNDRELVTGFPLL